MRDVPHGTDDRAARIRARDAGRDRVAQWTRWAVVGGLTSLGLASAAAAASLPGRAAAPAGPSVPAGSSGSAASGAAQTGAGVGSVPALQSPAQAPAYAPPVLPPVTTSGGS